MLARSFGPRISSQLAAVATEYHVNQYWRFGQTGKVTKPQDPKMKHLSNPLAIYSQTGGERFIIHHRTHPLASFHLAASITELSPDSASFPGPQRKKSLEDRILDMGKAQFNAWCKAFKQVVGGSEGRLRIRFFVGDALQFCLGLKRRREDPLADLNSYSRPWSSQCLRLDESDDYLVGTKDRAPLVFNIIETSNLVDEAGFLNVLISVIPLLEESAISVLYTETMRSAPSPKEYPSLLEELLCGDASSMCALLGIVPATYITGVSTRIRDQAWLDDQTPSLSRISWKHATSIDPKLDPTESKLCCDAVPLAKFLFGVYLKMSFHESRQYYDQLMGRLQSPGGRFLSPPPHYSRRSFTAFLSFLKSRISADWPKLISSLLKRIEKDTTLIDGKCHIYELKMFLYLFGLMDKLEQPLQGIFQPGFREAVEMSGIIPPETACIIITVPRSNIVEIYDACVEGLRANMVFEILLKGPYSEHVLTSTQPIFGKVIKSDDGNSATIDVDPKGWHGKSDLQVCALGPAEMFTMDVEDPGNLEVSVGLQSDHSVLFLENFGITLEVFRCGIEDSNVTLVDAFPGLEKSTRTLINPVKETCLVSNDAYELSCPQLGFDERALTTRLTIKGKEARELLTNTKLPVEVNQLSSCILQIKFGKFKYRCAFPFPVVASTSRLRIARKSGWIELIAHLLQPVVNGKIPPNPLPLILNPRSGLSTFNISYINFRQLPRIETSTLDGLKQLGLTAHLDAMLSIFEVQASIDDDSLILREMKFCLQAMFLCYCGNSQPERPYMVTIGPKGSFIDGGGPLIFFLSGLYFDSNSHSVAIEAYVVAATKFQMVVPRFLNLVNRLKSTTAEMIAQRDMSMWKRALPALAERCRDWQHLPSCEYANGMLDEFDIERNPLCSCGVGKVSKEFLQSHWKDAAPFVTRVAIPALYPAGWLESTQPGPLARLLGSGPAKENIPGRKSNGSNSSRSSLTSSKERVAFKETAKGNREKTEGASETQGTGVICNECGNEGAKKCGGCGEVYYCGRDCQKKHWKTHKVACLKAQEEATRGIAEASR